MPTGTEAVRPRARPVDGGGGVAAARHPGGPAPALRDIERLFAAIRDGDTTSRERVILAHVPLVRRLARRHPRGVEPFEDVVQVGIVGLIKAVDRYRSDLGGTFLAFAAPTVLGEIRRHFRDRVAIVRLPRSVIDARPLVHMAVDDLRAECGRTPSVAEITIATGLDGALVREVLSSSSTRTVPLVDEVSDLEPSSAAQWAVEDAGFPAAEARIDITAVLGVLGGRDRTILRLRYVDDLTQSEIAERVGISQMHVSRQLRHSVGLLSEATAHGAGHADAATPPRLVTS